METTKILTRRDGTLVIECRIPRWMDRPTKYDTGLTNLPPHPLMFADRPAQVGDVGCLGITEDWSPDACRAGEHRPRAWMLPGEDGIPGNSNGNITRCHGWRGTTDDARVEAHGIRRVVSITPVSRGLGWRVILSADLSPETP